MIWNSLGLMSAIDVVVIAIVLTMLWVLARHSRESPHAVSKSGLILIACGVSLTGVFHLSDLISMLLLPQWWDMQRAMQLMEFLHLNVRWIVTPVSILLIFVGFMRVIRHGKRADALLRQSQKRELAGQLAAGVAHDFNNLMTVIVGHAEFARSQLSPSHPGRTELQNILAAASRANKMTRQLMAFSRRSMLETQRMDLNELVRRAEPMLKRVIGASTELRFSLADSLGAVEADAGEMEQVLLNLVINARDAVQDYGTVVIATAQRDTENGGQVELSVSDTGCGMDDKTRSQVFEPFFTSKPDRGTGLGLPMVQGIVKQSGGDIAIETAPGRGTTVRIVLPRVEGPAATLDRRAVGVSPSKSAAGSILVVEDQGSVRRLAVRFLDQFGYEVVEAQDGEEALSLYRNSPRAFDLVFTDVRLPGMNGFELCREIRARRSDQPVVFVSGNRIDFEASGFCGAAHLLEKPYTQAQLERTVRDAITQP